MRTKLLIISLFVLICTAFSNAVSDNHQTHQSYSEIIEEHISDNAISSPDQKLLVPRQSEFASQPQSRTISKRPTSQRKSNRYTFYISGRPVADIFIKTYQQEVSLFPTGLNESYRFFISLCRLII